MSEEKKLSLPPSEFTAGELTAALASREKCDKELAKHGPGLKRWIVEQLLKSLPEEGAK